jgi:murein DD-endopeptidase MepM/ murein hydrolase activator NlpD
MPVAEVQPHQLRDTFHERRPAGHLHQALDIPAARGTPVLAAASGHILKLASGPRGGIALYQMGCDGRTVYYYAHLDRYAEGLAEGQGVPRGQVLGYVGATGNAGAGNYHLHFALWVITDPQQYWRGSNVNPYPLLLAPSS